MKSQAATTAEKILTAAVELYHRDGYVATNVQHITAHAGYATGTFYLHFASKEATLVAVFQDLYTRFEERIRSIWTRAIFGLDPGSMNDRSKAEKVIDVLVADAYKFVELHRESLELLWKTRSYWMYAEAADPVIRSVQKKYAGWIASMLSFWTGEMQGALLFSDDDKQKAISPVQQKFLGRMLADLWLHNLIEPAGSNGKTDALSAATVGIVIGFKLTAEA